ncbi:MAG: hypothetical protein SGARI_002383 [Bacillariaceae sp.]
MLRNGRDENGKEQDLTLLILPGRFPKEWNEEGLSEAVVDSWRASAAIFTGHTLKRKTTQGLASEKELKRAFKCLSDTMKAFADLAANGHPAPASLVSDDQSPLFSMDLARMNKDGKPILDGRKIAMVDATKKSLADGVWVPQLLDGLNYGDLKVLKVTIKAGTTHVPDLLLLSIKNSHNMMAQFEQKPFPAWDEPPEDQKGDAWTNDSFGVIDAPPGTFVPPPPSAIAFAAITTPEKDSPEKGSTFPDDVSEYSDLDDGYFDGDRYEDDADSDDDSVSDTPPPLMDRCGGRTTAIPPTTL